MKAKRRMLLLFLAVATLFVLVRLARSDQRALAADELPDRIAAYEKSVWQAYYDRQWPRALWLLVRLNHEAFQMPWPTAISAALDSVRAAIAFAPAENNDISAATRHLTRFYDKARRSMDLQAAAGELAALEMDYWVVHRELAIKRKKTKGEGDIEPMVASLGDLHTAIFEGSPEAMRQSAEHRALAAVAVDRITGGYSADEAADWREVEEQLRLAYRAIGDNILR